MKMLRMQGFYLAAFALMGFSPAWATPVVVPEIDGSSAVLAIGLTAGLVALIRERRKG